MDERKMPGRRVGIQVDVGLEFTAFLIVPKKDYGITGQVYHVDQLFRPRSLLKMYIP
jgi:hypothetical protein